MLIHDVMLKDSELVGPKQKVSIPLFPGKS